MVINPRPTTLVANAIFDSQSDENNGPRRSTRASAGINPHLDEMYNTQAPPLEPVVRRSRNRSPSMFSDNPCSTHVFRVHPNRKPPASPSEKKLGDRRGRPPSASKDPGDVNDLHEALDELRRRPTVRRPCGWPPSLQGYCSHDAPPSQRSSMMRLPRARCGRASGWR